MFCCRGNVQLLTATICCPSRDLLIEDCECFKLACPAMSSSFHRRIKKDIELIKKEPVEGIFVETDEEKLDVMYAVIVGPKGTPYEGGFFYFIIRFPEQYPMKPPSVKFMTTGNGNVRFNPNLYTNGKVCISILGTWSGPGWQPIMSLRYGTYHPIQS